ncbi:MAG TPA: hypothetical protein VKA57_12725 [Solirubrobacteraceae bacterium]|nr:hypothetical protein [Solirubrobacteraceae bacterium]
MLLIIAAILAALGILALLVVAWVGVPLLLAAAALVVLHVVGARKADDRALTIERARTEPTGAPRTSSGGADTANKRVGQA